MNRATPEEIAENIAKWKARNQMRAEAKKRKAETEAALAANEVERTEHIAKADPKFHGKLKELRDKLVVEKK